MTNSILIPLAPGFEEIEAVTIIDVLRRAGLDVQVVGLTPGPVLGAHGITVDTDGSIDDVDAAELAMLVLPGGLPGATNLRDDARVLALVRELAASGRYVSAICAAPIVLGAAGVLQGRAATCYPGFEGELTGATPSTERVVKAGNVITSRGPGTALEFALALVAELAGADAAQGLREGMLVPA
jgi:4-methyl-5(b-hydroxyethyl)-thiazole monophosphate biosynthesis